MVVTVGNSDQSLLPGMTANAEIEVSHRDNVLRVSNAALRLIDKVGIDQVVADLRAKGAL